MRKIISMLILTVWAFQFLSAQGTGTVDSLKQKLVATTDDSLKAEINIQLASELLYISFSEALSYAESAKKISKENKLMYQLGRAHYILGKIYRNSGDQEKTLKNFLDGIRVFEKIGEEGKKADGYLLVGSHYYKINLPDEAIKYYKDALEIYKKENDKSGESFALNNLGNCYQQKGDYENAKKCFNQSLKIDEALGNVIDMAGSWVNLGTIAMVEKKYSDAEKYFNQALEVFEKDQNDYETAVCLVNLGEIMNARNDHSSALIYFNSAMEKAKNINNEYLVRMCYYNMAFTYSKQEKHEAAFENLYHYVSINDSLNRKDMVDKLAEMARKYEADKKEKEIQLLNKEKKVAEQKNRIQELENKQARVDLERSRTILWFSLGGLVLLTALAVLLVNRNRIRKRANELLSKQKQEIYEKSLIIEEKNRDITDSILYAKRIQDAILREENKALSILPEHFIFFKPKDIVSGDFYWTHKKGEQWYFAVVDCTGHGVPGAFMSMLGIAFLNEISATPGNFSPADIMNELREKIIRELGQTGNDGDSMDGMDMSMIKFNPVEHTLEFCGAQNPAWIVRNKEIIELKGDKQPVAYQPFQTPFTNHKIQLQKKDVVYLFSDGYADQFGGPDLYGRPAGGKKFKYKRLKDMLQNAAHINTVYQKEMIERAFIEWKGDYEQIDDVTLVGIRF
ncbi:MAG: tetratricopeptide repeat protein [Bacteroidota bacterium]